MRRAPGWVWGFSGWTRRRGSRGAECVPTAHPTGPRRDNAENMYYFSELALTLNENEEGVAPTDSRLRPDQRLMEKGHWDEANTEKQRLEEKQRVNRRRRLEACSRGCGVDEGEPRGEGRAGEGLPGAGRSWGPPAAGRGPGSGFPGAASQAGRPRPRPPCRPTEKEAEVYVPLWFEKKLDPLTGEMACVYKGGYWEAKERQDWHMCPNIF